MTAMPSPKPSSLRVISSGSQHCWQVTILMIKLPKKSKSLFHNGFHHKAHLRVRLMMNSICNMDNDLV